MRYAEAAEQRKYWGFKLGERGRYVHLGRAGGFIGVAFEDTVPSLAAWESKDYKDATAWPDFREMYSQYFKAKSAVQLGIQAGQVWAFVVEMVEGDLVAVPSITEGKVLIGEVAGGYYFEDDPGDGSDLRHRRPVRWMIEVPLSRLSEPLRTTLRSLLTIFRIADHHKEVEALASDEPPPSGTQEPISGSRLSSAIIQRLFHLSPHEFQSFIADVLNAQGFEVVTNPIGPDGGIDVVGVFNVAGLAEITVGVQVKRRKGTTGAVEVRQLRGAIGDGVFGLFISLGGFTKQARLEAGRDDKPPVRLIDGPTLAGMILENYDRLDEGTKEFLGLKKRATNLADQFEIRST